MSLQWQLQRSVPEDTARIGQAVLKPSNAYRLIGDHFHALFPEETVFAPMYQSTGRGAIPPLLAALVTVFQMLEKVPDRTAAEFLASRIDWKYALHLPLTYPGFHFTDLMAFRQRLLAHKEERRLFDELLIRLKALGVIKPRGKMRSDSTHILAVVERLSQLELVTESIRVALRAVNEAAPEWVQARVPAAFREEYQTQQSQYGLSQSQVTTQLVKAGQDGFWFLAQLDESASDAVRRLPEVETLRRVLEQQYPAGPGQPPTAKRSSGGGVIESPHEPEARRGKKGDKSWLGYKAQVTETCDDDQPRLIVDLTPTRATENDQPALPDIQARLVHQDTSPGEQYVDQGYMSAALVVSSAKQGIELVGRLKADTHPQRGFRQADFEIDEAAHQAVCPAGHTSVSWRERARCVAGQPITEVRFSSTTCRACSSFGVCTRQQKGRSLELHPLRAVLAIRRQEAKTEAYTTRLKRRAGIEGTISELVRVCGLRRARYRGQAKLGVQCLFSAVAVNLKRLMRWWAEAKHPSQPGVQMPAAA